MYSKTLVSLCLKNVEEFNVVEQISLEYWKHIFFPRTDNMQTIIMQKSRKLAFTHHYIILFMLLLTQPPSRKPPLAVRGAPTLVTPPITPVSQKVTMATSMRLTTITIATITIAISHTMP